MRRATVTGGMFAVAFLLVGPALAEDAGGAKNDNPLTIEPAPSTDAQEAPGGQTGKSDAGSESDVDVGTAEAPGKKPSTQDVLSAMKGNAAAVSTVKSMSAVSKVHVVRIGQLPEAGNTPSLESAIEANRSEIDNLQSAIGTNQALKTELDKQNVDISSVVATRVGDDGSLTVYVN